MGRIILCDRDERFVDGVRSALGSDPSIEYMTATSAPAGRDLAVRNAAQVVLFGPSTPVEAALEAAAEITTHTPAPAVVLVAQRVTTDLLRSALRVGMRDVLSAEEQSYVDVANSVRGAYDDAMARLATAKGEAQPETPLAQVVTVFSTKGGVGKSVIATNLGAYLARDKQRRVAIVDLDFESSDVAVMLNLQPVHTIVEAAQAVDRLDTEMLTGMLVKHDSGLLALLAPARPEDAEIISVAKILRILEILREIVDIIIIDTPPYLNENVLAAIGASTQVLGVATMEMTSVKNMRVALQKLRTLGFHDSLLQLVLNRSDSKVLLEIEDVERALGMRTYARIPSDRLVPRSVNKGVPVVVEDPKSPVARSVGDLAMKVAANGKEAQR